MPPPPLRAAPPHPPARARGCIQPSRRRGAARPSRPCAPSASGPPAPSNARRWPWRRARPQSRQSRQTPRRASRG
eukprot:5395174-Pleurochrysis_carterae.AAC.1